MNPVASVPLWPSGFVSVTLTAPAAWAGVVAVRLVLLPTVTFVAALPPKETVAPVRKLAPVRVTAVPPAVEPLAGATLVTVGAGGGTNPPALNVAICMTQLRVPPPLETAAVALTEPVAVTMRSSAMSRSGVVMIRDVNPVPAAVVVVVTRSAPKISSFTAVVVAAPLLAVAAVPNAPAVLSRVETPAYSRMRTSGNAAGVLNVTVTVGRSAGPPPVMLLA